MLRSVRQRRLWFLEAKLRNPQFSGSFLASVYINRCTALSTAEKIGAVIRHISEMVQGIGGTLLLFAHRKSHRSFQLVPKLMTLNDLERRITAVILRYFTEFGSFGANYVIVVVRPCCLRHKCNAKNSFFGRICI